MDTPDNRPPRFPPGQFVVVAVLLAAPVVALMWVSSYDKADPHLFGFPFFYWYQFVWVFLAAITTSIAYRVVLHHERRRRAHRAGATDRTDGTNGAPGTGRSGTTDGSAR